VELARLSVIKSRISENILRKGCKSTSDWSSDKWLTLNWLNVNFSPQTGIWYKELNLQLFIKDVGEIVCSDSKCIIVEIFFVIDTREKLKNGKTTDQSLQKGNYDKNWPRWWRIWLVGSTEKSSRKNLKTGEPFLWISILWHKFVTMIKDLNCFKKIWVHF